MNARNDAIEARRALLNGSGKLPYFERRGLSRETIARAYLGFEDGTFLYPCVGRNGGLLGIHYKSEQSDDNGKRRQWWAGYADDLPPKGHGKKPGDPAKIIPFGLETLEDLQLGSRVILACGEEDALSLRQIGFTALSQSGAGLLEPVYAGELAGFEVVIFYDAGEEREATKDALKVEQAGAKSVRVVEWPTEAPHGADVNGKLVEDPEGFKGWAAQMISDARPLTASAAETEGFLESGPRDHRAGRPDTYKGLSDGQDDADTWEDPTQLPEGLPAVEAFDTVMLPAPLRPWIEDMAERMQIPPDFLAAGAVVVLSSLVGRKFGIHPKKYDDWLVVPNLWGAVVGRPAMQKSPALAEVMRPLGRLAAEAREGFEAEMAAYELEVAIAEADQAALRDALKKAARESEKSGDRSGIEEAMRKFRGAKESSPREPSLRRYKSEDPTVEKLCELLLENPRGILVHRDELSGWLRSLDKLGREGDRSLYLESWNGIGAYEVDRIGRGSLYIPALCVSILGGIQPGPLGSYVWAATRGGEGNDGLLQRFQILVWPDPPSGWRNVDRWPDRESKNRAYEVFRKLDSLSAEEFGATATDEDSIPAVRFTPKAQEHFDAFREDLEARLRSGELSPSLEAHLAKYRSLMPALALVFAAVDFVGGRAEPGAVGPESALQAWAWCAYLESHARRLYSSAEDPAMEGARALLRRIKAGQVNDGTSVREVYRRNWTKLAAPEEVKSATRVLEDYGWIRIETLKTGGRSTARLRLHPTLKNAK